MERARAARYDEPQAARVASEAPRQDSREALHPVLALQGVAGNRAVGGLVQTKLRVGPVGDSHEHEADRVAESVAGGPGGARQPASRESPPVPAPADVERGISAQRGRGQPLPADVRAEMEGALGAGFGDVRVHTGGRATALNDRLAARAFTTGRDIFVSDREPRIDTGAGRHLIAHELAHVVQQSGGAPSSAGTIQRHCGKPEHGGPFASMQPSPDERYSQGPTLQAPDAIEMTDFNPRDPSDQSFAEKREMVSESLAGGIDPRQQSTMQQATQLGLGTNRITDAMNRSRGKGGTGAEKAVRSHARYNEKLDEVQAQQGIVDRSFLGTVNRKKRDVLGQVNPSEGERRKYAGAREELRQETPGLQTAERAESAVGVTNKVAQHAMTVAGVAFPPVAPALAAAKIGVQAGSDAAKAGLLGVQGRQLSKVDTERPIGMFAKDRSSEQYAKAGTQAVEGVTSLGTSLLPGAKTLAQKGVSGAVKAGAKVANKAADKYLDPTAKSRRATETALAVASPRTLTKPSDPNAAKQHKALAKAAVKQRKKLQPAGAKPPARAQPVSELEARLAAQREKIDDT